MSYFVYRILTTKKGYRPPGDVEERVREIVSSVCEVGNDWKEIPLQDGRTKHKVCICISNFS